MFLLESLLSIDNAAVLAVMVKNLPVDQRSKALKYGIWGAFLMRGASLFFVSWLIRFSWLKIAGGLYLLYLAYKFFFKPEVNEETGPPEKTASFWGTVALVELMDMNFSIDNIFAATALSNNISLILIGVFMGIIAMRFVAGWFSKLIERYPNLETCAFSVIALLGLKIILAGICEYVPFLNGLGADLSSRGGDICFSLLTITIFGFAIFSYKHEQHIE